MTSAQEQESRAGALFSDGLSSGGKGPLMITIEAGVFQRGCVSGILCGSTTWGRRTTLGSLPIHEVRIDRPFALSVHEVTRGDFRVFVERTGYRTLAERPAHLAQLRGCVPAITEQEVRFPMSALSLDGTWREPGFAQSPDHPVVCVAWRDAVAYSQWLAAETGRDYRLPSEAEWEYAARANSPPVYREKSWYCDPGARHSPESVLRCHGRAHTLPVESLPPNAFGLRGMGGSVYEFVEDCAHPTYEGAPRDGSARLGEGECESRVVRDGGWGRFVREEVRQAIISDLSSNSLGFRVAQSPPE